MFTKVQFSVPIYPARFLLLRGYQGTDFIMFISLKMGAKMYLHCCVINEHYAVLPTQFPVGSSTVHTFYIMQSLYKIIPPIRMVGTIINVSDS